MHNKRSLKIRIMLLYVIYFAVLVAGFIFNVMPNFRRGADLGFDVSHNMMQSWSDDRIMRQSRVYIDIPANRNDEYLTFDLDDDKATSISILASRFNVLVTQNADKDQSMSELVMSSVGGSTYVYLLSLLILILYIAIFAFIFLIIHSLRKSLNDDTPLDNICTWYTRIIGILIIVASLCSAASQWYMNNEAAKLLADSEFTVNTSFPLNYWNILIAILVIFTAEVFSIGSRLGEEQKLTI
ncbi:MAG: DUF2975 domain-containing protein [Alistipes sp.]|nr:DUF2975 domain-containing protein [Alistipes sp.]